MLKIIDNCGFAGHFSTLFKRDEIYLNFRDKLFIVIKHAVFIFDSKTNQVSRITDLTEDHKGASMIYVPADNSVYCVSGVLTNSVERIPLTKKFEVLEDENWLACPKPLGPRAYYSHFVKNDSVIYIVFGYNMWDNAFLMTADRFDVEQTDGDWENIKLKGDAIPRLVFTSSIAVTDDDVYIFGGMDDFIHDNNYIYYYDVKRNTVEKSQYQITDSNTAEKDKSVLRSLFYHESYFIPLKNKDNDYDDKICVGQLDSKGILHVFNIKNLDYFNRNVGDFFNKDDMMSEQPELGDGK